MSKEVKAKDAAVTEEETTEEVVEETTEETTEESAEEVTEEVEVKASSEFVTKVATEAAKLVEVPKVPQRFVVAPTATPSVSSQKDQSQEVAAKWVKAMIRGDVDGQKSAIQQDIKLNPDNYRIGTKAGNLRMKAVQEGTAAIGGNLVPTEFDNQVFAAFDEYSEIISSAAFRTMSSNVMKLNELDTKVSVHKTTELGAVTASTPTWSAPTLTTEKYIGSTTISQEMIDDAELDVLSQITRQYGEELAYKVQDSLANSSVSGSEGLLQASGVVTVAMATTGSYTNTTWADLRKLKYDLMGTNGFKMESKRGKFYLTPQTWEYVIQSSSNIQYQTNNPVNATAMTIDGNEVVLLNEFASPTTAGTKFVLFGDLTRHLVVGRRLGMRFKINTSGTAADGTELNYQDAIEVVPIMRLAQVVTVPEGLRALVS